MPHPIKALDDDYFPQCAIPGSPSFTFSLRDIHTVAKTPPLTENWLGASLFILYILAALALTITITYGTLFTVYSVVLPTAVKQDRGFRRRLIVLTSLSLLSFTTITYNMLNFLITSYNTHTAITTATLSTPSTHLHHLTHWLLHSNHFTTFTWSLITPSSASSSSSASLTAQTSLTTPLLTTLLLAPLCRSYALHPALYATLSQILPPSFALSLLLIHILLLHPTADTDMFASFLDPWQSDEPQTAPILPVVVLVAYAAFLRFVPCVVNSAQLLVQVGAARAALAVVWILPVEVNGVATVGVGALALLAGATAAGLVQTPLGVVGENWAIRTMAGDMWVCVGVVVVGAGTLYTRRIARRGGDQEGEGEGKKVQ